MTSVNNHPAASQKLFLKISVYLTGFNEAELEGTGMVVTYYQTLHQYCTEDDLNYFFKMVETILTESDQKVILGAIRTQLMPLSAYGGLAQKIITLWYTGTWPSLNEEPKQDPVIISSQAYIQGLIWTVIEAHPPGAKQPGYGSWSLPPL